MNSDATQAFLQWWCFTWRWADRSWLQVFSDAGISLHAVEVMAGSRHQDWLAVLGIAASQPVAPCPALVQWLALDGPQRDEALRLAGRICFPAHTVARASHHELWCRSLAKALRPGAWISPDTPPDARLLLGTWIAPDCWPRLLLSWPKADSPLLQALPGPWPPRKLETLWQALLWRVCTPSDTP